MHKIPPKTHQQLSSISRGSRLVHCFCICFAQSCNEVWCSWAYVNTPQCSLPKLVLALVINGTAYTLVSIKYFQIRGTHSELICSVECGSYCSVNGKCKLRTCNQNKPQLSGFSSKIWGFSGFTHGGKVNLSSDYIYQPNLVERGIFIQDTVFSHFVQNSIFAVRHRTDTGNWRELVKTNMSFLGWLLHTSGNLDKANIFSEAFLVTHRKHFDSFPDWTNV